MTRCFLEARHVITGCLVLTVLATASHVRATPAPAARLERVRAYVRTHQHAIVRDLVRFLRIPNLARDRDRIRENAQFIAAYFKALGVKTRLLEHPKAPPIVYGEYRVAGAQRTILFYAHYDGQPVVPDRWSTPPWEPTLRDARHDLGGKVIPFPQEDTPYQDEWRIYARSASDDKSPIIALGHALKSIQESGWQPAVNLKFFFEGEEEVGSPHLHEYLDTYRDLLQGDLLVMCDGPVHQTRRQQLFFGARGIIGLQMTVYGPARPLHSGHYGNWAPNPIAILSNLVARMRDARGKVLIPGFYQDVEPLGPIERQALREAPDLESLLKHELGLAWTDQVGRNLYEAITLPGMNLRGFVGGAVGAQSRNVIPTQATVSIDFRLVKAQDPTKIRNIVEKFLRQQGFHIVYQEPDMETRRKYPRIVKLEWERGYPAARTPMDIPMVQSLIHVVETAVGEKVVKLPTLGGSGPIYQFEQALHVPFVGVPMVNHDNNQHAPNENLRLKNLWDGILVYAAIMLGMGS